MYKDYIIFAIISLIGLIIRSMYDVLKYKFRLIEYNRFYDLFIVIVMIIGWSSWFRMNKFDPIVVFLPVSIKYFGLVLYIIGIIIAVTGASEILIAIIYNIFTKKNIYMKHGIFGIIRHPMYYGFIIFIIGLPLYKGNLITFIISPLWIFFLIWWRIMEEKELEMKLKDYKEYKKTTLI